MPQFICSYNDLVIIGAGGHAREVAWVASEATEAWRVIGYLDDRVELHGKEIAGVGVLGSIDEWPKYLGASFVVAIGSPRVRRDIVQGMCNLGTPSFARIIHRSTICPPHVKIGNGSMIMGGCLLSTQICVGNHSILNHSSTIAHDTVIEDFCTVSPGAILSGNVTLREGVEVGTSTCIRQGITIGRGAFIGMGAVVTKDVPESQLFYGNPARHRRDIWAF